MTVADGAALEGKLVRLRVARDEDLPRSRRWYSDPDVRHWLHLSETSLPTLQSERNRWQSAGADPARQMWVIETRDGVAIGIIGLQSIDDVHRRAELGISIGEKAYWSRGYGTDAIRVLLRYAFAALSLRRVELIADIDNERGIRCYEKCGFVREGVLRAHRLRYGEPLDMLLMAVLRDEWIEDGG